ncbi:MAG TPA: lytic transglycosylase domain-containing protein, partial [Acidimicrobiales bacterium]|nr:lytic transglycosylase domain-containing protein [Acidimicrobiales bacterium]
AAGAAGFVDDSFDPATYLARVQATYAAYASGSGDGGPSEIALSDIPPEYLALYQTAGSAWGIDWAVLAGVGKVECDHGRSQLAGCNPRGTVNVAGARGPMQFLGSTWRSGADTFAPDVAGPPIPAGQEGSGYATDGDGDGVADPWTPADAIHAAARMLLRNGAPGDYRAALWAYNPLETYRNRVLDWAARYRNVGGPSGSTARLVVDVTPWMQALLDAAIPRFGRGHAVYCLRDPDPDMPSQHPVGQACDFMMSKGGTRAVGAEEMHGHQLVTWLIQNADLLHVRYIIWQQRIWSPEDPRWKLMEDRRGITANHFDHVHVSVLAEPGQPSEA